MGGCVARQNAGSVNRIGKDRKRFDRSLSKESAGLVSVSREFQNDNRCRNSTDDSPDETEGENGTIHGDDGDSCTSEANDSVPGKLTDRSSSQLAEKERRRLSISTVTMAQEDSLTQPPNGKLTKNSKNDTTSYRSVIRKFSDPAIQLVDEQMGGVKEVSIQMILSLAPDAVHSRACFGAPSYEPQNGYDNKEVELFTKAVDRSSQRSLSNIGIGYSCKKGLKPESPNQDDFFVLRIDDWGMFGVFDGHGPFGHEVSHFVHNTLPFLIISDPLFETDVCAAFKRAFRKVHDLLQRTADQIDSYMDITLSGTTATVVIHRDRKLYVAHVGDSRCVLARKDGRQYTAIPLTQDHKPTTDSEKSRIEEHGGEVRRLDGDIPYRVFIKNRMYPGLAMSRAIGDSVGVAVGVISEPDVRKVDMRDDDAFILLCTDGVWEFISSQEAVNICAAKSVENVQDAAEALASESWARWVEEEKNVVDDITCLVHWLQS